MRSEKLDVSKGNQKRLTNNEELTTHYFYDKQGNLIMTKGRENKKYEYDAFNQLKAVNGVTNVKRESIANETGMKREKTLNTHQ